MACSNRLAGFLAFLRHRSLVEESPADAEVIGLHVLRRLSLRQLAGGELAEQGLDDAGDDLVLHGEDIGQIAVEALGPEMAAALARIDQLGVDADAGGGAARAALEDIAHAEIAGDLADIHGLVLEREAGVAGDDEEAGRLRELGDEILGQAVGEELLLGVGAEIREGEHGDRGLGGQRQGFGRRRRRARRGDAVDADRRRDILERPLAEIVIVERQLAADLVVHFPRHDDAAGLRDLLEARGDVDAVAVDVAAFDHDVAQIDADAERDAAIVPACRRWPRRSSAAVRRRRRRH